MHMHILICLQQTDSPLDPSLVFGWRSTDPLAAEGEHTFAYITA